MQKEKTFYRSLPNLDGFSWVGYWDSFHHFTKKIGDKYAHIRSTEHDIKDGNIYSLIKYKLTK
jgi:hypothetical protein